VPVGARKVGMQTYRIYELDQRGHIVGPSQALACDTEQEALEQARRRAGALAIEIWRGTDLIARLEPAK
jgi:hypothetical protein